MPVALVCAQEVHIPLNDDWQFQQVGKEQWYSAEVPGVVQSDLMRHGLIPDIYKGSNIDSVQWIENEDWIYKRTIVATDTLLKHEHLDLVFKGLDTFAEVYLNDSLLGKADNMFRTWEWPIKSLLRLGSNELKVIFRSPIKEGAKLRDAYGIQLPHDNDPSGVSPYIRKAAYQFGWDFCPRLVTSGIWQRVELGGGARRGSMRLSCTRSPRLELYLAITPIADWTGVERVHFMLDGKTFHRMRLVPSGRWGMAAFSGEVKLPDLWWPLGEGDRPLHTFTVELISPKGEVVHRIEKRTGFRSMELVRSKDELGASFTFRINGRDIFMRGCNVVPPSMVPCAGDSAWVTLVSTMQRAQMNMARIWAGGVYPPEAFFDACDTAGILVWQDFAVANLLPAEVEFLNGLWMEEASASNRIMHHPSLAVVCTDNELEVAWRNWGWQERYGLHGQDSVRVARGYEETQRLLARPVEGRNIPYTRTSPLSNWGSAAGLRSGDLHYWGVWHGDSTFSSFKNNVGRFVSEYGFQSYPDSALLAKYIDPKELYLGSPAMKRLQRSYKTDRPIWEAMERELGEKPTTLGGFIEGSQRAQALAYQMAIEAHMSAQPHCMGTLLWQLNDCWPGPSWSIIDFEGKPKPAYHIVKRLYTGRD
ncbi:MAG: hypothetical protein IPL52_03835 [Flavobacteriales bacterium]|nr:hypothetical protein [Flavobacteriales bacterium]